MKKSMSKMLYFPIIGRLASVDTFFVGQIILTMSAKTSQAYNKPYSLDPSIDFSGKLWEGYPVVQARVKQALSFVPFFFLLTLPTGNHVQRIRSSYSAL